MFARGASALTAEPPPNPDQLEQTFDRRSAAASSDVRPLALTGLRSPEPSAIPVNQPPQNPRRKSRLLVTPPERMNADFAATVEDHRIEGSAYFPAYRGLRAGFRAGVVSGASFLGGPGIPLATLAASPYFGGSLSFRHAGKNWDALAMGTATSLTLRTHPALGQDDSEAEPVLLTPAGVFSFYADSIGILRLSERAAVAIFGAADAWSMTAPGSQSDREGNVGLAAAMNLSGRDRIRAWAQVEGVVHRADSFRNDKPNGLWNGGVFFDGVRAGADYTHRWTPEDRMRLWYEHYYGPLYRSSEAGFQIDHRRVEAAAALKSQRSHSPWALDETGVAATLHVDVGRGIGVEAAASYMDRQDIEGHQLAPDVAVMGGLDWRHNAGRLRGNIRARRRLRRQGTPALSPARFEAGREFFSSIDRDLRDNFKIAVHASDNLSSFAQNLRVADAKQIVQAAALMTYSLNDLNYNFDEGDTINAGNAQDLYRRWRESYISGQEDPMMVCIGAAQVASELAVDLGARLGLNVEASSIKVVSIDENEQSIGHAVPMIRLPGEGFVFVDWGNIIPTNTFDPEAALAVYQAQNGGFAILHTVGDTPRGGRYDGRIITEQGRPVLDAATFHGDPNLPRPAGPDLFHDDPRGAPITRDRALDALDRTLE